VTAVLMDFTTLKKEAALVCKFFAVNCRFLYLVHIFITKILFWLVLDCLINFPDR